MSPHTFYDVSEEDIFGEQWNDIVKLAIKNGLEEDEDSDYDPNEVIQKASSHSCINGDSYEEILIDYWCTNW